MAVIKCKMCGGDLEIVPGTSVAECDSCGTRQTLPKANEEVIQNLFNRANALRIKCEFDKAEQIYEKILQEDNTESEAHWGIVLCKYGIEYVEDPKTFKRIPTCHRTSYDAVTTDADYLAAVEHADVVQRSIYEAEAKAIDQIQKNILSIVKDEKPFDVFICYKESDENGRRTVDSTIANDIYYQLTQEGLKVFYAAITLEDKLGQEYEPYIFAALNSAKVMLVIGTKSHYFSAVWVKNEWSRFLKLMKSDRSKLLIPCYKDMDAYELPEEFAHLQAQDMSKIGFINDVVRGIKKVTVKEEPKSTAVVKETIVTGGNTNIEPLLKRVFMFLEDRNWDSANEYCEKVLDIDPENASAYLGKMMAELRVHKKERLADYPRPLDTNKNYLKVLRFADNDLVTLLSGYNEQIKTRNENKRLADAYSEAQGLMAKAKHEQDYRDAAEAFAEIPGYQDADAQAKKCLELAEEARKDAILESGIRQISGHNIQACKAAIKLFESISGWKDADRQAENAKKKIAELQEQAESNRKDAIYTEASGLLNTHIVANIEKAIPMFDSIPGWRDADALKEKCSKEIARIKAEIEEKRIQAEKDKQAKKKKAIIIGSVLASVAVVLILLFTLIIPAIRYSQADKLLASGQYEAALNGFWEVNFSDSREKYATAFAAVKDSYREKAANYEASGDSVNAAIWYRKAGDIEKANEIHNIESLVYAGEYISAGIMADGTLKYQTNNKYDRGAVQEDLAGITAFLRNTGDVVGVDAQGRLLTHKIGTFDGIEIREEMHIESYSQIVSVLDGVANDYYVIMLLSDGTVVEALENPENDPYPQVKNWKDIQRIQSGYGSIYGIDVNGNVYQAIKADSKGENYDVSSLKNVRKLISYIDLIVLHEDGTVTYLGENNYIAQELDGKNNVQDIVSCTGGIIVLYQDGTVELLSTDLNHEDKAEDYENILSNLKTWNGIVSIQAGAFGAFGIRYDGTVRYVSTDFDYSTYTSKYYYLDHAEFTKEVENWTDIVFVAPAAEETFSNHWIYAMGVKSDGTVESTGNGKYYTAEKNSSGNSYHDVSHDGGTYHLVSDWKLW